jgi:hypothetical protein
MILSPMINIEVVKSNPATFIYCQAQYNAKPRPQSSVELRHSFPGSFVKLLWSYIDELRFNCTLMGTYFQRHEEIRISPAVSFLYIAKLMQNVVIYRPHIMGNDNYLISSVASVNSIEVIMDRILCGKQMLESAEMRIKPLSYVDMKNSLILCKI